LSINLSSYLFKQYFRQPRQIELLIEDFEEENQNRVFYKCLDNEFFVDAQKSWKGSYFYYGFASYCLKSGFIQSKNKLLTNESFKK